jgi:hypothetical protein
MKHTRTWLLFLGVAGGCAGTKPGRVPAPAPPEAGELSFEVMPLRHAAASELASTLNELLEASCRPILHRGCALPKRGLENEMYRSDRDSEHPSWNIVADPRTNSLVLVTADLSERAKLLELIARLDADVREP